MGKLDDYWSKLKEVMSKNPKGRPIDEHGKFWPNPIPLEPPIGYQAQPDLAEQIRSMVRSEQLRVAAEAAGYGSMEDEDDFEVGDDWDPMSPYEYNFDPPLRTGDTGTEDPLTGEITASGEVVQRPPSKATQTAGNGGGAGGGSPQTPPPRSRRWRTAYDRGEAHP